MHKQHPSKNATPLQSSQVQQRAIVPLPLPLHQVHQSEAHAPRLEIRLLYQTYLQCVTTM